jgi:hypothetical protein
MAAAVSRPRIRVRVRTVDGGAVPVARIAAAELRSGRRLDLSYDQDSRLFIHDELTSGTYDVTVEAPAFERQARRVEIPAGDALETFVLGAPGLPFYYRGRVKVPFDQPLSVAIALTPGATQRIADIRDLVQRLGGIVSIPGPDANRESLAQGVAAFDIPDRRVDIAGSLEHAARALPFVQAAGVVVHRAARSTSFLTHEIVVRLQPGASMPAAVAAAGLEVRRELPYLRGTSVLGTDRLTTMELLTVCNRLADDPGVLWAEPNLFSTIVPHADPYYSAAQQPHHWIIDSASAWALANGSGSRSTIAILDMDGFPDHEDLRDRIGVTYNFVDRNTTLTSGTGHGTKAAGIALATTGNAVGVAGVAGAAKGIAAQISASFDTTFAEAFIWAAGLNPGTQRGGPPTLGSGADVISCSWGLDGVAAGAISTSPSWNGTMGGVFDLLEGQGRSGRGTVVVFSAGNEGVDLGTKYPWAAYPTNLAVASVTTTPPDQRVVCNFGVDVDICAPGGGLDAATQTSTSGTTTTSTDLNGNNEPYGSFSETSCACPQVAGAAAVLLSITPSLTAFQVRATLCATAVKIDPAGGAWSGGHSVYYGFGRLNLGAAANGSCGRICRMLRLLMRLFRSLRRPT